MTYANCFDRHSYTNNIKKNIAIFTCGNSSACDNLLYTHNFIYNFP